MCSFEGLRDNTLQQLGDAYAAGHIRVGTLEHRIEETLVAVNLWELHAATWDLPTTQGDGQVCRCMVFQLPVPLSITFDDAPQTWGIGRSRASDVFLREPLVSRRHALLSVRGDVCTLRDLDSTNGVAVNGVRISKAVLRPGDQVSFAGVRADLR